MQKRIVQRPVWLTNYARHSVSDKIRCLGIIEHKANEDEIQKLKDKVTLLESQVEEEQMKTSNLEAEVDEIRWESIVANLHICTTKQVQLYNLRKGTRRCQRTHGRSPKDSDLWRDLQSLGRNSEWSISPETCFFMLIKNM